MAIVIVGFRNAWPTRRLMLGPFVFRSIGQAGFLLTDHEMFLAVFPNLLEPLFLVTATILAWERVIRHPPTGRNAASPSAGSRGEGSEAGRIQVATARAGSVP